ncbi:aldehyde dehydrogenase family protein [Actinoallomurus sp. NPDC050550]|uniref:aldehyde dehydrogenase family protein n=1 Tax=Actinoallomurus sp. NPDC050550 TaxID=3154937 RepID=UPI003404D022
MTVKRALLIDGRDVPARSGRTTEDRGPCTGEVYALVAAADAEDVRAAVGAAHAAFPRWAATPPSARRALLMSAADLLESRLAEFSNIMLNETGGTRAWARVNVKVTADQMRQAATAATAPAGHLPATDRTGQWSLAVREPAGVVAAIVPWNAPLILCARTIMVALAVGDTVVLRPSEDAPITSGLFLADVLRDAGLPDGALNVVTNDRDDAPAVIEALIADPRVRRVAFTGSTAVGRIVGRLAGEHLKPAALELGGKNPIIVCEDADLDHAVSAIAYAKFQNSGQVCLAVDRIILNRAIAGEFTTRFVEKAASLRQGDPADPDTVIGPLINERAVERIAALVDDAVGKGARTLLGGGADGRNYPVTVLDGLTPEMRVYHEETFGPVASLYTVADDDAAVALANDTDYGLTSAVFTRDTARALSIARRLRHGSAHVNAHTIQEEPQAPIGGIKDSGFGAFGGPQEIDFFTEARWITLAEQSEPLPF